jgi:hypothetical protein
MDSCWASDESIILPLTPNVTTVPIKIPNANVARVTSENEKRLAFSFSQAPLLSGFIIHSSGYDCNYRHRRLMLRPSHGFKGDTKQIPTNT